jgi:Rps23 Pro-64 3,4-dihydroxylase Tpa1-like proline 4-hydroxylase
MINKLNYFKIKEDFNDTKKPFRYTVISNFFNKNTYKKLNSEYPPINDKRWYKYRDKIDNKKNIFEQKMVGISNPNDLPSHSLKIFKYLNSYQFCKEIEKSTGIKGLLPDTHNEIGQWAGMRAMLKGAYQKIHSDARLHPHLKLEKKITIVGYVNDNWVKEDGGYTEIWNNTMTKCVDKVAPIGNSILLFENTSKSYHGVPEVNSFRKSFLISYVTKTENFKETRPKAQFVKRPNEDENELWNLLSKKRSNLSDY